MRPEIRLEERQAPSIERDLRRDEPDDGRDAAEHQRLGEELRDDPAATRAECAPHDQLALSRRGAREEQQCDVPQMRTSSISGEESESSAISRMSPSPSSLNCLAYDPDLRLEVLVRGAALDRRRACRSSSAPPARARASRQARVGRRP